MRGKPVGPADRAAISVAYPARFELHDAGTLLQNTTLLQPILSACGDAPNTERELIQQTIRQLLIGLDDDEYKALDDEIEVLVETKARLKEQIREMLPAAISSRQEALEGAGSAEEAAGEDPTGQSGGTAISNTIPSVV